MTRFIVVMAGIASFVLTPAVAVAQSCVATLGWENRNRHVYGSVNVECGNCNILNPHTPPWGNWGVTSWYVDNKKDEGQFAGWKSGLAPTPQCRSKFENIDDPQWNSCTDGELYTSPSSEYYNHNRDTEQFSADVRTYATDATHREKRSCPYDTDGDGEFDSGGCEGFELELGEVITLYELDRLAPDQKVTVLVYPDIVADISCEPLGCTSGFSPWTMNRPNPIASAEVRMVVQQVEWQPEGACPQQ